MPRQSRSIPSPAKYLRWMFCKNILGLKAVKYFRKSYIINIWLGSKCICSILLSFAGFKWKLLITTKIVWSGNMFIFEVFRLVFYMGNFILLLFVEPEILGFWVRVFLIVFFLKGFLYWKQILLIALPWFHILKYWKKETMK